MASRVDVPTWYAVALGGLLSLLLAVRLSYLVGVVLYSRFRPRFLAHLVYSENIPPFRSFSRLAVIFGLVYVAGNAASLAVGTASLEEAGSRAGLVALANLVFLTLGPLSLVAGCFGWPLARQRLVHACAGFVASLEVLIHAVVAVSSDGFHLSRANSLGVAAGAAVAASCFSGIFLVRGELYEVAFVCHSLAWKLLVAALWVHITPEGTPAKVLRILSTVFPLATLSWTWFRIAWRNFSWTRGRTVASVRLAGDALRLTIASPRPWTVTAGQYVYLTVPRASTFSIFQRHPFTISWWRRLEGSLEVTLLVQPRKGFTRGLERLVGSDAVSAWIDGPYGRGHELSDFGTVVLFSTGIGIWSHLLYVKQLVGGYRRGLVKVKSIQLHWRVDRNGQQKDTKLIMDKLLKEDRVERRLEICIYVPDKRQPPIQPGGRAETAQGREAVARSRRIVTKFEEPDVGAIVKEVLPEDGRKVVISVSAFDRFGAAFKRALAHAPPGDVHLAWEEFQPPCGQPPTVRRDHMSFQCVGDP